MPVLLLEGLLLLALISISICIILKKVCCPVLLFTVRSALQPCCCILL